MKKEKKSNPKQLTQIVKNDKTEVNDAVHYRLFEVKMTMVTQVTQVIQVLIVQVVQVPAYSTGGTATCFANYSHTITSCTGCCKTATVFFIVTKTNPYI